MFGCRKANVFRPENRELKMNRKRSASSAQKYRFSITSLAPKITEMMINSEKNECLERTDKKNEKETTSMRDYQR